MNSNGRNPDRCMVGSSIVEFRDIERRPAFQQVADQLREAVIEAVNRSLELPGENDLSRALTVSRPTLREALRILEAEGLVIRESRTSAIRLDAGAPGMSRPLKSALTVLSRTERISLAEILDLRETIAERAAYRAAEVATEDDIRVLEEALAEERRAADAGEEVDSRGLQFHTSVVMAAHNDAFFLVYLAAREAAADLLEHMASVAKEQGARLPVEVDAAEERAAAYNQIAMHEKVLEAIRGRRGEEAAAALVTGTAAFYAPLTADGPGNGDRISDSSSARAGRAREQGPSTRRRPKK
jgi:GntR family transcriptional repressor for pyruvate dehydrogenase complex